MLVYATTDDLAAAPWNITPAPANAGRLLATASRLVRRATVTARYATDPDGAPTDEAIAAAMRDATCAQVLAWTTADVDPAAGGVQLQAAPVQSKRLGSGGVTYDTAAAASVTAMNARIAAATDLTGDAVAILADAGLTGHRPGTYR